MQFKSTFPILIAHRDVAAQSVAGVRLRQIQHELEQSGWKTILVVSDGFHLFRVKRMFVDNGILAYTSPAPNSPIETEDSQRFWYSLREVVLFAVYRWFDL